MLCKPFFVPCRVMVRYIEAKTILSRLRTPDDLFGIAYNMNVYRGCQHGCIYCDTRSDCYGVGDISSVAVKANALTLLDRELRAKGTRRGTIGTGSMNDPYMPLERSLGMVRKALEVISARRFPVHVITKSDLVVRDADVLQEIASVYAAVSFSVTLADDVLARRLEPGAPPPSARLAAMERLAQAGIYTGLAMMPVLPFITDSRENIREVLRRAKGCGASYVLFIPGVTLRAGSREYFYRALDRDFAGMRGRYEKTFGRRYMCWCDGVDGLYEEVAQWCGDLGLSLRMRFYDPAEGGVGQLSLF